MQLKLVKASPEYKKQITEMLDEWYAYGEKIIPYAIRRLDYHDFEHYYRNLEVTDNREGLVPDSTFFCFDAERDIMVGAVNIRHYLNEALLLNGGHIGDGVRPSERRKGVATKMIGLAFDTSGRSKLIRPAYTSIVGIETYQDKHFIVLRCPGGESRPYSSTKTMTKDNKERIHYIRKASNTVEPSDDEEKDLFQLANRVSFDDRVNHQAEMSDLNITLIQNYLKEVKSSLYEKAMIGQVLSIHTDRRGAVSWWSGRQ